MGSYRLRRLLERDVLPETIATFVGLGAGAYLTGIGSTSLLLEIGLLGILTVVGSLVGLKRLDEHARGEDTTVGV